MKDLLSLYWPIACLVLSNIFYHITAKEILPDVNPFANMVITYIVGALISLIMFFTIGKGENIIEEIKAMNWAPYVLGLSIVGLEAGAIYMYKTGWEISIGNMIASVLLSIALIFVGFFVYREQITTTKVFGILICLIGLYFINK